MKLIVFEGYLRDMYPDGLMVAGDSAAECISALRFYPGFRESDGVRHEVHVPGFDTYDSLYAKTDAREIRMVPMAAGAGGRGGMSQILLGVVLVALTAWNPLGLFAGSFAPFFFAGSLGASLIANGVVQMLSPQPSTGDMSTDQKSNYLAANRNTTKVGTRIPLVLGKRRVYGHILSFNVTASSMPPAAMVPVESIPENSFTAEVDSSYTVDVVHGVQAD